MKSIKDYYRTKYKGSLFVIKAGGRVIADDKARHSLLNNIKDLVTSGIRVLLIYGGGHLIDEALKESGIEPVKVDGRRITTGGQIDTVKHVMAADLSYRIGSTMAEIDLHGLCLSTLPPGWVNIALRPKHKDMERFDGTIQSVFADQIINLFGAIPFAACPCISVTGKNGVNINADDVAVAVASATQARKLIFLSDVDGVLVDGKTAPYLTDSDIPKLIENGTVTGGMRVKLENCLDALNNGVRRIHLLNGFTPDILIHEIYESVGPTTMLIQEKDLESYLNEIEVEKTIKGAKA